jgi:hypothetical protein
MDLEEPKERSFIVKVWVEDSAETVGQGVWRGYITHVSSGKRYYIKNLAEISDFIAPHLEEMGVKLGVRWRVSRWFKRMIKRS